MHYIAWEGCYVTWGEGGTVVVVAADLETAVQSLLEKVQELPPEFDDEFLRTGRVQYYLPQIDAYLVRTVVRCVCDEPASHSM